jgi:predicted hydrolase (HD superfamily)
METALDGTGQPAPGPLPRADAWELLCQWTPSQALRRHGRAVELVMIAAATQYGPGPEAEAAWGNAGLLHDADYESWPDEHPQRIVAWLADRGGCADIAHAISAHYSAWGVSYDSLLDKALLACDELTGFVGACCHVRPGGIATLTSKSVVKKLKNKSFAAKVERTEVHLGIELLDVDLKAHIEFIIDALRPHGDELGLEGQSIDAE